MFVSVTIPNQLVKELTTNFNIFCQSNNVSNLLALRDASLDGVKFDPMKTTNCSTPNTVEPKTMYCIPSNIFNEFVSEYPKWTSFRS